MVMKRLFGYLIVSFILLSINSCTYDPIIPLHLPSALAPKGPDATHLANLWWVMLAFGTAVFVLVIALLIATLLRRRRGTSATPPDSQGGDTGRKWLFLGGILLPVYIVGIIFSYSLYTFAIAEKPHESPALKIEVVGRRWWWEVKYLEQDFSTANEIHIPVGVPVEIQIESADVNHSFWVPELNGKMEAVPTEINHLIIQADKAGIYHGQCAEFCGLQHGHMGFIVFAQSQEDFNSWLEAQQQPAATPADPTALKGQQVFLSAGCVFCHPVNGLDDKSIDRSYVDLGPNLTHINSRMTIAAASLANNQGSRAGWVVSAQNLKPNCLMPNNPLTSEDLQFILAYLDTLK
jgi:cytochrome c oxidase subunit II